MARLAPFGLPASADIVTELKQQSAVRQQFVTNELILSLYTLEYENP